MNKKNCIFIATSIDGYIADEKGHIDWLHSIQNPNNDDMGYVEFNNNIDALIMGRITYETVCGFNVSWSYDKPVFVLSNTLKQIAEEHKDKVFLVKGSLVEVLECVNKKGYQKLYIDGGVTIQSFLKEDLIDEMIITTIPIILGGGYPLFSELLERLEFELVESKVYLNQLTQSYYKRKK